MSRTRKRRGRRRPNPITLTHDPRQDTTTLNDARFGIVTIPGYWPTVAEFRKAIDRLPSHMVDGKFHN